MCIRHVVDQGTATKLKGAMCVALSTQAQDTISAPVAGKCGSWPEEGVVWVLQVATMSAFWTAVILGRAFEVYSHPNTIPYSAAYDWANINISPQDNYEKLQNNCKSQIRRKDL
jgi:hypothetical protein